MGRRNNKWLRKKVAERDGPNCSYCGVSEDITLDHIVPVAAGGCKMKSDNLQLLCRACNETKGDGPDLRGRVGSKKRGAP